MSWENFSAGPVAVHSSAGAPSGLPTARLASRSDTSSIGPLGGTPTCQYPSRPGQSCTVVSAPGSSTSIRGSGSVSPASVEVECDGGPEVRERERRAQQPQVGDDAVDPGVSQRRAEAVKRLLAVAAERDDLREQRVVARGNLQARFDPGVDPDACG